jgi:hypothetical protein
MFSRCELTNLGTIKCYSITGSCKGNFWFARKHAVAWSAKMEFVPLFLREISLGPSSDWIKKCMAVLGLSVNQ